MERWGMERFCNASQARIVNLFSRSFSSSDMGKPSRLKTKQNDSPYRLEPTHRHVFGICLFRKPRKQPIYWHKMCPEYRIYICRNLSLRYTSQPSNQCTHWMRFLQWSMIFLRCMVYTQHHRSNLLHCSIFQQGTRCIDRQKQDQYFPKNDL